MGKCFVNCAAPRPSHSCKVEQQTLRYSFWDGLVHCGGGQGAAPHLELEGG